jgi:uncharacterized membrane protein
MTSKHDPNVPAPPASLIGSIRIWLPAVLASWVYGCIMFMRYPETVPVHWNAAGEVDRYGSRTEAAFLLPGLILILSLWLFGVLPLIKTGQAMTATGQRAFSWMLASSVYFMLMIQVLTSHVFLTGRLEAVVWVLPWTILLLISNVWLVLVMNRHRIRP